MFRHINAFMSIRIASKKKAYTFKSPLAYRPVSIVVVKQQHWVYLNKLSGSLGGGRRSLLQRTIATLV
jgi:hypothetical protein